jgi:hypothetical protein
MHSASTLPELSRMQFVLLSINTTWWPNSFDHLTLATLKWDEVVYTFLLDFDLLHDAQQDIRHCPWATPASRLTLDTHFKILPLIKSLCV